MTSDTPRSRWTVLLLCLVAGAFALLLAVQKIDDDDTWWHLRTGQWIVANGRVPHADIFSFTTPGAKWVPHYWLGDVIFVAMHRLGGVDALILGKAAVVAAAFVLLLLLMARSGVNPVLAAALTILAAQAGYFRFSLRPHVFGFPLLVGCFWLLSASKGRDRRILWLLALMCLWVNLHGSFVLGSLLAVFLAAEAAALWAVARLRHQPEADAGRVLLLVLVAVATLLVWLASPFGLDLVRWVASTYSATTLARTFRLEEFEPLRWGEYNLFWGLMIATAASFLGAGRRARLFHLLAFLATAVLAIRGVRFVAEAALVHAAILGHNAQALLDRIWGARKSVRLGIQTAIAAPVLAAASALLLWSSFRPQYAFTFGLGINPGRFPDQAVEFLRRVSPAGNLYNSDDLGGYLLWRLPDRKVFFDERNLDAQLDFATRLSQMGPAERNALFARLDIRAAIVRFRDGGYARHFQASGTFRLVFFDDQAMIFLGKGALTDDAAANLQPLDPLLPALYDPDGLARVVGGPMAESMEQALHAAAAISPQSSKAQLLLGIWLEVTRRPVQALDHYLAAGRLNPRLAYVRYDLGRRAGRVALAIRQWDKGIAVLEPARQYGSDSELLFLLGTAYYQSGRRAEAKKIYRDILSDEPGQVSTLVNLGFLLLDEGSYQEAERYERQALARAAGRQDAAFGLALSLERQGKRAEALAQYRDFLRQYPRSPWAARARAGMQQLAH